MQRQQVLGPPGQAAPGRQGRQTTPGPRGSEEAAQPSAAPRARHPPEDNGRGHEQSPLKGLKPERAGRPAGAGGLPCPPSRACSEPRRCSCTGWIVVTRFIIASCHLRQNKGRPRRWPRGTTDTPVTTVTSPSTVQAARPSARWARSANRARKERGDAATPATPPARHGHNNDVWSGRASVARKVRCRNGLGGGMGHSGGEVEEHTPCCTWHATPHQVHLERRAMRVAIRDMQGGGGSSLL